MPCSPGSRSAERRACGAPRSRRRRWGSGRRAGRASGCRASRRSAPTAPGEIACSSTSASSWTRSHDIPSASARYSSSSRWWRMTSSATRSPGRGQLDAVVGLAADQAERLEPLDHRRRRRRRDVEPLGDRRGGDGLVASARAASRSPSRSPGPRRRPRGCRWTVAITGEISRPVAYMSTRPADHAGHGERVQQAAGRRRARSARSGRSPGRSPRRRGRT